NQRVVTHDQSIDGSRLGPLHADVGGLRLEAIERCRILAHEVLAPRHAGQINGESAFAKSHPPLAVFTVHIPAAISRQAAFGSLHWSAFLSGPALHLAPPSGGGQVMGRRGGHFRLKLHPRIRLYSGRVAIASDDDNLSTGFNLYSANLKPD